MLSYMLPMEDKPPPAPPSKGKLQLELEGARRATSPEGSSGARRPPRAPTTAISKESSTSSFASSDLTGSSSMTPTGVDKPKLKLLSNGTKHTTLKRVSFGSSKGSMVETLIYESPLQEEPEAVSPQQYNSHQEVTFPFISDEHEESERSKVRVSFYQGVRPQCVSPPPTSLLLQLQPASEALVVTNGALAMSAVSAMEQTQYNRQISTESGWDNPFRPDGDLSREADEIVSLIKGGKPITSPPSSGTPQLPSVDEIDKDIKATNKSSLSQSPPKLQVSSNSELTPKSNVNGTTNGNTAESRPGQVDIQRSAPQEPLQAEHVVIKKKPKCKCCVVQ